MKRVIYERWGNVHVSPRVGLGFSPHMHDELEIVLVNSGSVTAYIDDCEYTLEKGALCVIFPNQLHSYVDNFTSTEPNNYIMIFSSDVLASFSIDFMKRTPKDPVIRDKEILSVIERYFEEAVQIKNAGEQFSAKALNAYSMLILSKVLPLFEFKTARHLQKDVSADIFAYCNSNFCEDISLEKMAKDLNVSKEHIMRLFRERLRTSFRAYINQLRIDKAKKLLKTTDHSVTEIASLSGYNTIRSFNRAFLDIVGLSPTEYRNKHAS